MTAVQNRDQFATQSRNKRFLMKIDKYSEYLNIRTVLKLVLGYNYTVRFIAPILLYWCYVIVRIWKR